MFPVRCFTCGKLVGDKFEEFWSRVNEKKENPGVVLDSLGFDRICCRRMLLASLEYAKDILPYMKGIKYE
jgi:DNA-directed RNA polymerase subunit N